MKLLYLLLFSTLLLIGCKKPEQPEIENQIGKKWTIDGQLIQFDNKDFIYSDSSNVLANWNTGRWEIVDSNLIIYSIPDSNAIAYDSSLIITTDKGTSLRHFKNGQLVYDSKNKYNGPGVQTRVYQIRNLTKKELTLVHEQEETITLAVSKEEIESHFGFTSIYRGLIGILSLLIIGWLFSNNRKAINWSIIIKGVSLQIVFALLILKVPFVADIFSLVSQFFVEVIQFTQEGTRFLFSSYVTNDIEPPLINFAINVLPTIIFFSALTSLLYYWGILQRIVYVLAIVMKKFMNLSGAESMAAAGNIFLGQTESPLLVKPYLGSMTKSEMMCLMTGGMATIAGGVLAAYIGYLGGDDPEMQLYFARHLLAASLMSAPAAILFSKMLVPETENFDKKIKIPKDKIGTNALEAIANGTTDGLKLAVNVGAMLLVFIALMAMANYILRDLIGEWTQLNPLIAEATNFSGLTFEFLLGYGLSPVTWLMGVPWDDITVVGELLGKKTIINEFVAYTNLGELKSAGAFKHDKSLIMATYMLCGFANFASIGIQIGGIGSLVPSRKSLLSQLGFKALIGGTLACLMTAVIVGIIF